MSLRKPVKVRCPDCGKTRKVGYYVAQGRSEYACKSCTTIQRNKQGKHGFESHPLYRTWTNMKRRIDKPHAMKDRCYAGLDMDPKWRDVITFIAWATKAGWEPGLSIERKDNAKGYWPRNCKFIPTPLQARHRRDNSMSQKLANEINRRVVRGEIRFHVAKDVHGRTGIPLSTCNKVAYGVNWQ